MKTFVMSVLTSLILMSIIFAVGPRNSISRLEKRVNDIDKPIMEVETNNTQLIASLTDSLNEQMTYFNAVQEQLTASVQTVDENQATALTSMNNDISTVKSLVENEAAQRSASITTLTNSSKAINNSLSDLSDEMDDLEAAIEDLEEEVSEGELTAEITSTDDLYIYDADDYFSGTTVIKVSNDTNDDIEDIELSLSFKADEDIPDVDTATLTS